MPPAKRLRGFFPDARAKSWLDFTPIGYNYCGPGNRVDNAPPLNRLDAMCKEHDIAYGVLQSKGVNPYVKFNEADQTLLDGINTLDDQEYDMVAVLADQYFGFKKKMMSHVEEKTDAEVLRDASAFKRKIEEEQFVKRKRLRKLAQNPMSRKRAWYEFGMPVTSKFARLSLSTMPDVEMDKDDPFKPGSETDVKRLPYERTLPFNDSINVIMPYYQFEDKTFAAGAAQFIDMTWRMNSIYDVRCAKTYVENDPATSIAAGTPAETPMYRNYWNQFYQYWTVTHSTIKVVITPLGYSSVDIKYRAYLYRHGGQKPPLSYASNGRIPHYVRRLWPNHKSESFTHNMDGTKTQWGKGCTLSWGWNMDEELNPIALDSAQTTWVKGDAVPTLDEFISLHVQQDDGQTGLTLASNIKVEAYLTYHVQYRDLKAALQFPLENITLASVSNFVNQVTG